MTTIFGTLYDRLVITPPSLGVIMGLFIDPGLRKEFKELVEEYLPEHKNEILNQCGSYDMASAFKEFFDRKYFETADFVEFGDEEPDETLRNLVNFCPIELYGIGSTSYDSVHYWDEGQQLMLSVIRSPEREQDLIPYIEQAIKLRGDIARKLPLAGWPVEELREITSGTEYEPLAEFAEWVHQETGISIMDNNWEDGWDMPYWDHDEVEQYTREYRLMDARWERQSRFMRWLEEDPANYAAMVNFLLQHSPLPVTTESIKPKTLMEVFSDDNQDETERIRPATKSDLAAATRF